VLTSLVASVVVLGLAGGLHCAVMCGPLACTAATVEGGARRGGLRYLGGRFAGHVLAGAVFGHLGAQASRFVSRSGVQLALVLGIAALLFLRGLRLLIAERASSTLVQLRVRPHRSQVGGFVASLLPRRALPLGLATSALPCGLLASAWALAAAALHPLHGAIVMAAFSVASAPGLVAALVVGLRVGSVARRLSPTWQGALWCALGLAVAARPLFDHCHSCCH